MPGSVVVIGGGVAAACAAIAAKRAGAGPVVLVRRGPGASSVSSGCVDLVPGGESPEALTSFVRSHPWHPYALLASELAGAVGRARALLVETLGLVGSKGRNLRLATPIGAVKETWLAQPSIARGDLEALPESACIGVVGLRGAGGVDAGLVADGLRALGRDAVDLDVPGVDPRTGLIAFAGMLDDAASRTRFVNDAVAAAKAVGATHLLLPSAGASDPVGVVEAFASQGLGAAELLGLPPSVPGMRLEKALLATLAMQGVETIEGRVTGCVHDAGRVTSIAIEGQGARPVTALVLATGRYVGGGISSRFDETTLGLPVFVQDRASSDRPAHGWWDRDAHASQPAMTAGVRVDATMRVLDVKGRAVAGNLFAAGGVVGGWDAARDGAGLGVAAVTGLVAGENAARWALDAARAVSA